MGWIGVDLDGTLAHYDGWGTGEIGDPVPAMMRRVKQWLAEGKTVKIFTARAGDPHELGRTRAWLSRHGIGDLDVTNVKDFGMIELYDDRCVQVVINTGQIVTRDGYATVDSRRIR